MLQMLHQMLQCYTKLGDWVTLSPWHPRASSSSTTMVQQDWSSPLQAAPPSQITITGLEPQVQLDMAGRSENFLVDTGTNYSVLTACSGAFSSQTCTILGATGKTIVRRFTQAFLCCWDRSFWWSLSALLSYWKERYFIAQSVKDLPAVQETPAQSLGWKDLLEKEIATHSSILAWI